MATRYVSDVMTLMRRILSRRNENDPDSSDTVFFQYIQDFVALTMSDDLKIFEQFGTLKFVIDESNPTGVYTFNEVGADATFTNISTEGFISLTDPPDHSVSWNRLWIWQDPGTFFSRWGVDNDAILIPGYPTDMLYYGTQMTFRTIPNTSYNVTIYGYKEVAEFSEEGDPELPEGYWLRYVAYGASLNYARDFRYDENEQAKIGKNFFHEKKLLLTRTHNQIKTQRSFPRF